MLPERCSGQWNRAEPCGAPGHKSLSVSSPLTISWLLVITFLHAASMTFPESQQNGFKQSPVREGRGYRGGAVKKWQCNLGVKLWFLKGCVCVWGLSCVWFFVTPGTEAQQASTSMGFSRQEYWNGLPFPPPGDLSDPEAERMFPVAPALACRFLPGTTCVYMVMYSPSSWGTYVIVSLSCFADTETLLGGRS